MRGVWYGEVHRPLLHSTWGLPAARGCRLPARQRGGKVTCIVPLFTWLSRGGLVGNSMVLRLEKGQGYNSTRYSELAPDNSQNPADIAGSALGKGLGCTWQQYQYNYQRKNSDAYSR